MLDTYENIIQRVVFPDLQLGRPGWDLEHTRAVVFHTKAICDNTPSLDLDRVVLVIAAYLHDWGYSALFDKYQVTTLDGINKKELHMQIGAEKSDRLLRGQEFSGLSDEQISRIVHLVFVHDRTTELSANDELVLMEADTLGSLDQNFIKVTFDQQENDKFLRSVMTKRRPYFITAYAKREFRKHFHAREKLFASSVQSFVFQN